MICHDPVRANFTSKLNHGRNTRLRPRPRKRQKPRPKPRQTPKPRPRQNPRIPKIFKKSKVH